MRIDQSLALLERAKKVIPSMTQTFSKGPNQWVRGISPHYLTRGEGAWVWDVDGNRYLDYLMALGPITLGYGCSEVDEAVKAQVSDGAVFSQMHPLEVEVAELLVDLIPCAEMVRFAKNGSDVTTGAVRAARAYTKRDRILFCGYHGWHDWYIGTTTRNKGVPDVVSALSDTFTYNDLDSLEALFKQYPDDVAAVIMEPIGVEMPKNGFLEGVRDICTRHGALLIFDEIVNGFRVRLGGGHEYFGVMPDMACFGKGMANGLPLSAVVGRKAVMQEFDEIFFSGTFGGEVLSLASCKATVEFMKREPVIEHLWKAGEELSGIIQGHVEKLDIGKDALLLGLPVRSVLAFPHKDEKQSYMMRTYIMQECVKRGLLYFCSHIPCYAHKEEELAFTRGVLDEVFPLVAEAIHNGDVEKRLEGKCVEAIFRKA